MAKFNIYKIQKEKEEGLREKMLSAGLSLVGQKVVDGFTLSFYLSENPQPVPIWWVDLYREFIPNEMTPKNRAHFAVFIISNTDLCYAVSMGKSHFYLKNYCDINFGINLAERIADEKHLKLKNSKLFGGKRNKAIIAYQENSELEFDSGESIHFLKSKTIDPEEWGEVASFGNSVLLNLEMGPNALPGFIQKIENILEEDPKIFIPRATRVTDPAKIEELDQKLAEALQNRDGSSSIQAAEPTVSGVDFLFLDKSNYRFMLRHTHEDVEGELSVSALCDFMDRHEIDLLESLDDIKVKVFDENDRGFAQPLKFFLDYVDDERHFLLDGVWHVFNENYIEFLKKHVDERISLETPGVDLSSAACEAWRSGLTEAERNKPSYPEAYFNSQREGEGYLNLDRDISILQGLKIEKLDLWKDGTAFFVKIGTPSKLGYGVDQAMATIKVLQNKADAIRIQGQEIKPQSICIWFILDRQTGISKLSEIKSLILLMKLAEWQRQCTNAGFKPIVRIGYRVD